MAETSFGVTYDGPALETGRIPVRDLAPALLALGDLFAEASTIVYPGRPPVALSIEATREGSFVVRLIVESVHDLVDLFGSDEVSALVNLKELLLLPAMGLIALIKQLRARRVTASEPLQPGMIRLTLEDGTTLEVRAEVATLFEHADVCRKVRLAVEPLAKPGIERIVFEGSPDHPPLVIEAGDLPAFDVPEPESIKVTEEEIEMTVSIMSLTFVEGNKWRLSVGDDVPSFNASIEDAGFLSRVDRGVEAFRAGDMLRVRMRIEQTQRTSSPRLHAEYRVVEVLQHIPRPWQLDLGDAERS